MPLSTYQSPNQTVMNGPVRQPNEQLVTRNSGNTMGINDMESMITDVVMKVDKLTAENKNRLAQIRQLQNELVSRQGEMRLLQIRALDRLALL